MDGFCERGVLAVDMDGTLIKTDVMQESVIAFIVANPLNVFLILLWWTRGRARLKEQLARRAPELNPAELPYNTEFLRYLKAQQRPLILATAAHRIHAEAVAAHVGIFQSVIATENDHNLIGANKAQRLADEFGDGQFAYAGDSRNDIAVWKRAGEVIMVNPVAAARRARRRHFPNARVFDERANNPPTAWRRALRPHHYLKNLLVFVALIGGHQITSLPALGAAALAFLVFCLLASATYLINDVFDIAHDRRHPHKKSRPIAAGEINIFSALIAAAGLLAAATAVTAAALPAEFALVAAAYVAATTAYSLALKRLLLVDVLSLSLLFTLRILGGGAAILIELSFWLLAFSIFVFMSLALLKRYVDLASSGEGHFFGRAYRGEDGAVVMALGVGAGMISALVLALYINSDTVRERYDHPEVVWLALPLVLYWVARLWVLGARREMTVDPLVFVFRDRASWAVAALVLALAYLAA